MSAPQGGAGGGLDWPGLMRAGLKGLGLLPREFWALTPAELALMLGAEAGPPPLTRGRLEELAARWPDAPRPTPEAARAAADLHRKGRDDDRSGRD